MGPGPPKGHIPGVEIVLPGHDPVPAQVPIPGALRVGPIVMREAAVQLLDGIGEARGKGPRDTQGLDEEADASLEGVGVAATQRLVGRHELLVEGLHVQRTAVNHGGRPENTEQAREPIPLQHEPFPFFVGSRVVSLIATTRSRFFIFHNDSIY